MCEGTSASVRMRRHCEEDVLEFDQIAGSKQGECDSGATTN